MTIPDVGSYAVNDIYASIQGEGALAGTPMVILRLQGCNLACPWCDTRETWNIGNPASQGTIESILGKNEYWVRVTGDDILDYIIGNTPRNISWVLITGGEPALQNLQAICSVLHKRGGYKVALETSGTATGWFSAAFDWICVSPKLHATMPVLHSILPYMDELKVVIGKKEDITILENLLATWKPKLKSNCIISLQPVSLNKSATELCLEQVIAHNWRLSLQMHRYMDIS